MRARSIKPGFFKNEEISECSFPARLLFPGLWMLADREGKLEYRPKRIKAEIFPFDNVDIIKLIAELEKHGMVKVYTVDGCHYLWVIKFNEHQRPHQNEQPSTIPNYNNGDEKLATKVQSPCTQSATDFALNPHSLNADSCLSDNTIAPSAHPERKKARTKGQPLFSLPCTGDATYIVDETEMQDLAKFYPNVDLSAEFGKMGGWLQANTMKTAKGMPRFIASWMARAQDRPRQAQGGLMLAGELKPTTFHQNKQLENQQKARIIGALRKAGEGNEQGSCLGMAVESGHALPEQTDGRGAGGNGDALAGGNGRGEPRQLPSGDAPVVQAEPILSKAVPNP